ncbi:uncharacterized protein Nmag_0851 [Natrialba magadii ATCC 43099]|uniref:DUF8052 domain-containing protein n=1 Tax=Natrialba magadii (strain ATCC 43099 / DSM 3394 / CCM 3739 / CIP 104546 / IAM 13178 / JCM 8861 / NBRC 102185 / NCIMB 2190 / MS3) TaxID=547559 RepID=D3T077_NATMM|nr:hypothetical protein [Natrialba magadii]ADD04435.1 uncharacterized protein Nmag_0851 [Natrialba magadii ATCC 43099]ELY25831.1 hypothetical protein C500_16774 [Natrialba magadii ATCC 43099]
MERTADGHTETGVSSQDGGSPADVDLADVPDWDDEYLDRVSDRLMHNYDLEKDYRIEGESFTLYGELSLVSQKHFLHPALSFAEHESNEHLFVKQVDRVDDDTLDRFAALGDDLADKWIEATEEHFCTEFTFVLITDSIPDTVRSRVDSHDGRTLLKYGYHGHYETNFVVVAPDEAELVASDNADVATAFRLWEPIEHEEPGLLGLLSRRLQL